MRKFTRISALVALILGLAGSIVVGVGVAMGGTEVAKTAFDEVTNDHNAHNLANLFKSISYWHDGKLFHIGDFWHDSNFKGVTVDGNSPEYKDKISYTVNSSSLQLLDIDAPNGNVQITEGNAADSIHIEIKSKRSTSYFKIKDSKDGKVKIECTKKHWNSDDDIFINIQVPNACSIDTLKIDAAAGDLLISGNIRIIKMDLDLAAGDATIEHATLHDSSFEMAAGDLTLTDTTLLSNLDIDCAAGDTTLNLPGRESDYNLELSCALGELEINGSSTSNGFGSSYSRDNNSNITITADCACGSIEVNFQNK